MAFHDLNRFETGKFQKMHKCPKIGLQKCKYSIEIVVPEPLVFSIQERPPHGILAVKRVTKRKIGRNLSTTIFLEQTAGTHDSASRKTVVRTTRGLKNSSFLRPQFCVPWFLTMFSAPELCVPLFFSSQKLAYHYFCNVWEGLICAYHYFCTVFICFFHQILVKCTKILDFLQISPKMVPGIFIMGFSHILYVIFHFLGPAVVPPTKGPQTSILSRNLRLVP